MKRCGIRLLHIFDMEWLYKKDIVQSRLKTLLHCQDIQRIYARKCIIRLVEHDTAVEFLNENHLQGACQSKYQYGLYYNDELVSIMTFGKSRFKKEFELLRFCNKLNVTVVGGASKLLQHFLQDHLEIKEIVSYADRRLSTGNLYVKIRIY